MRHHNRLRRLEAAYRRHRGDDDRIPVYIVDDAGKRITPAMYSSGNGIDYRHDLWMVAPDEKQSTN